MTASDCHQLAIQSYKNGNYQFAAEWFEEALNRLNGNSSLLEESIRQDMVSAYYYGGISNGL